MLAGDRKRWWSEMKTVAKGINKTLDMLWIYFSFICVCPLFLCCPTLVIIVGNFSDEITLPSVMMVLENNNHKKHFLLFVKLYII